MRFAVVIPARYQSTRLPGKPLVPLCGMPMIERTWRRSLEAVDAGLVYIATDDERIRQACESAGARVIMTPGDCLTGTDRVAVAADSLEVDFIVNLQGDEPVFNPDDLRALVQAAREHPGDVINGCCPVQSEEEFRSPTVPKVVMRPDGRLLYMSRAAIPTDKAGRWVRSWRQVCAYAFPMPALRAFAAERQKTPLEEIEDIEILRFLELGYEVRMLPMSTVSVAVDTPEDVARAEAAIHRLGLA